MNKYVRPTLSIDLGLCEGIFLASGSGEAKCSKGRKGYKSNSSDCIKCSNGTDNAFSALPGGHTGALEFKGCPENMPEKSKK